MERYQSACVADTEAVGRSLGKRLKAGDVVALSGDLGSGKTAFVKGVVSSLGNPEDVTSPTFTLVNEYDGELPVYHFDVYRLESASPEALDWMDDYLFGQGICLIEWAEHVWGILPDDTIRVTFSKNPAISDEYREITIC